MIKEALIKQGFHSIEQRELVSQFVIGLTAIIGIKRNLPKREIVSSAVERLSNNRPPVKVVKTLDSLPENLEERLTLRLYFNGQACSVEFLTLSAYLSPQESKRAGELIAGSFNGLREEEISAWFNTEKEIMFDLVLHNRIGDLFKVKDGALYVSYRAIRGPPDIEEISCYELILPSALKVILTEELILLMPLPKTKEIYAKEFYDQFKIKSNRNIRDSLDYILSINVSNDLMAVCGNLITILPVTFEYLRRNGKADIRIKLKEYFAVEEGRWPVSFSRRHLETSKAQFILEYCINGYVYGGYFGAKRDAIEQRLNAWFGESGWEVKHLVNGEFVSEETAIQHYEDAYFIYFQNNPEILESLINTAADVYDTAPSNRNSGTDYAIQETPEIGRHLQDIAIRRVLKRLGKEFRGSELIQIRGKKTKGYCLNPGLVPFHKPELISVAMKGWWRPATIEVFFQSTKVIVLADKVSERIFEKRIWHDASELAFFLFEKIAFLIFNEELCIDTIDALFWSLDTRELLIGSDAKAREFSEHEIQKIINEMIYLYEFVCEITKGELNREFLSMAKDWYGKITNPSTNEMYMTLSKAHVMFIPHISDMLRHSGAFPIFLIRDALPMYEFKKYESIVRGECFEAATLYQPGAPSRNTNKNKRSRDLELDEVAFKIEELMLNVKEELIKEGIINLNIPGNDTVIHKTAAFDMVSRRFFEGVEKLIQDNERFRNYSYNLYRRFKRIPLTGKHLTIIDSFGSGKTALYVKGIIELFSRKEGKDFLVDILLGAGMDKSLHVPNITDILDIQNDAFPDLRWPFYFDRFNYFVNQPVFLIDKNIVYQLLLIYQ